MHIMSFCSQRDLLPFVIDSIDLLYYMIDFCCWWGMGGVISLHQK